MTRRDQAAALESAVQGALEACAGVPIPDVLVAPATGAARIAERLSRADEIPLSELDGVPLPWFGATLWIGAAGETSVWLVDDAPVTGDAEADWMRAFPIWWAAAAGAKILLHTSAGTDLRDKDDRPGDDFELVRIVDHINLSGTTPLTGLGQSRFGPLFPDQTRLHDPELASIADACAESSGRTLGHAIAACTLGPALSTPAELRWYRVAGADVAVQRLADPLIAAAHAGLATLALCAVTNRADERAEVGMLVERAARAAPRLDDLVLASASRLGAIVRSRKEEEDCA